MPSSALTGPKRREAPRRTTALSVRERGSSTGASTSFCIAPSAGITPQVQRVGAGRSVGAPSQPAYPRAPLFRTRPSLVGAGPQRPGRSSAIAFTNASSCFVVQHSKTPSQ
jgi:hypothetical protein